MKLNAVNNKAGGYLLSVSGLSLRLAFGSFFNPLDKRRWPEQPRPNSTKETDEESKVTQEAVLRTQERKFDEWDALLKKQQHGCYGLSETAKRGASQRRCRKRSQLQVTTG